MIFSKHFPHQKNPEGKKIQVQEADEGNKIIDIIRINAFKLRVIEITSKKFHSNLLIRMICSSGDLPAEKKEKHSSLLDSINKNSPIIKSSEYYA